MSMNAFDRIAHQPPQSHSRVLELRVHNHPGVMSHICGLFARRAFNVEKILCLPMANGMQSRIWLTVKDDCRLDQIVRQVMKLEDVLEVRHAGIDGEVFGRIEKWLQEDSLKEPFDLCEAVQSL